MPSHTDATSAQVTTALMGLTQAPATISQDGSLVLGACGIMVTLLILLAIWYGCNRMAEGAANMPDQPPVQSGSQQRLLTGSDLRATRTDTAVVPTTTTVRQVV